jgi:hypothetical protein
MSESSCPWQLPTELDTRIDREREKIVGASRRSVERLDEETARGGSNLFCRLVWFVKETVSSRCVMDDAKVHLRLWCL